MGSLEIQEKLVLVICRGIPLRFWNNTFFERVEAQVGTLVEVDDSTIKREVLEFVRLRVRAPVGRELRMVKNMRINETLCQAVFEEEPFFTNT